MHRWITSISFILFLFIAFNANGQTYTLDGSINGTTINTCAGTFVDSGGSGSNYSNDESYSITFCSNNSGNLTLDFTFWNVENNSTCAWDFMRIYNGTSTAGSLIGTYCTSSPGTITSTGTCLHITWFSDNIVTEEGWEATISCANASSSCGSFTTYEDEFASASYSNSNGLTDWTSTPWTEIDGDANIANSGEVQITGGELRINRTDVSPPGIERAVNLTNATSATWNFDYREAGSLENADRMFAEVFNGSTWTRLLTTINDFGSASASFDITPYANANTRIRIRTVGFAGSGEFLYIDNVDVCYEVGSSVSTDFFLEAECGHIGDAWFTTADPSASNTFFVQPLSGENFISSPPADTAYYNTYEIEVDSSGDYELFARVLAPNGGSNAFWVRVNNGPWINWDGLPTLPDWTWHQLYDSDNGGALVSFTLSEGTTRIDFATAKDGAKLDKINVTLDGVIPVGEGSAAQNCYSLFGTDSDQDGIVDGIDLDDDNDGILDSRENPSEIDFGGARTLLVGSSQSNLLVGHKVLYDDAIRDCNDIVYDAVITITSITSGVTVAANSNGIDISGAIPSQNDYTTFTISVVENGSASVGNPNGTPGVITDIIIDMQDVDSDNGDDYTEVVGFNNVGGPTTSYIDDASALELGGFLANPPTGSWTFYRQQAVNPPTNWTNNDNIPSSVVSSEISMFMVFNNLSTVELVFGLTGSHNSAPSIATRATRFGANAECDRDGDGIPNRIDLDLDNDGIYDLHEAGHPYTLDVDNDGRIDGALTGSGANGIYDNIETSAESGAINFTYSQSDADGIEDAFDLDSDADGCFDTIEGDNNDPDEDGTAGAGTATADARGKVISIIYKPPPTDSWQDPTASCLEICGNGEDDDGDGIPDELDPDCAEYFLEAECGFAGALWTRGFDVDASNDDYAEITPGNNSIATPPVGADGILRFSLEVTVTGTYRFLGRVWSSTGADDSFWFRVDNGTWIRWNDWNTAENWRWREFTDFSNGNTITKFVLNAGIHVIDIAYSEDGARLDKLHLTINGSTPTDEGDSAINCGRTITHHLFLPTYLINK